MKKSGLLNSELIKEIAQIGHTQSLVIGDVGLPVPKGVKCIDLAVCKGIPSFLDVLKAVESEMVIESYIVAEEIETQNPDTDEKIKQLLPTQERSTMSHERFKLFSERANVIVRTGETLAYSNVILIAGVNF